MTEFKREIRVFAGYDRRDDPAGSGGADGCDLVLILTGNVGAITVGVDTGWMARPLATATVVGRGPQQRRAKPGIDAGLVNCYPMGNGTYAHSPIRRDGFESEGDECPYLDGGPCWNYGRLSSDDVIEALVSGGSDAAFDLMASFYRSWLIEATAS